VQYACRAYIQVLGEHQIIPSMSQPGHPHDNASCKSFLKTLKREEIYANDMEHLTEGIEEFNETVYQLDCLTMVWVANSASSLNS
jgi:putative transposase